MRRSAANVVFALLHLDGIYRLSKAVRRYDRVDRRVLVRRTVGCELCHNYGSGIRRYA